MDTHVIWARKEGGRLNIEWSPVRNYPLPFGAEIITTTERCDRKIVLEWCRKQRDNGMSYEQLKTACEGDRCSNVSRVALG